MNEAALISQREHEQALGRARSKRSYAKHKVEVLAQRKIFRDTRRAEILERGNRRALVIQEERRLEREEEERQREQERREYDHDQPGGGAGEYYDDDAPRVAAAAPKRGRRGRTAAATSNSPPTAAKKANKKLMYTREECQAALLAEPSIKPDSLKTYKTDINRLFHDVACADGLAVCFRDPDQMIQHMNDTIKTVNTMKQTLQIIIILVDKCHILENMNCPKKMRDTAMVLFRHKFDEYKDLSHKATLAKKNSTEFVPSFAQYLTNCYRVFPPGSKQRVVALLYSHYTLRDNFKDMKIVSSIAKAKSDTHNFLVKSRGTKKNPTKLTFCINDYKTKSMYKKMQFEVTNEELRTALLDWIADNGIDYGGILFKKTALSNFVSKMNKELGYENALGIDFLRHIRVTELYSDEQKKNNGELTFAKRKELADQMGHSMLTQEAYRRNLKLLEA